MRTMSIKLMDKMVTISFDKCKCPICEIRYSKTKNKILITPIAAPLSGCRCLSIQLPNYIVLRWYSINCAIKYIIFFFCVFHEFHASRWKNDLQSQSSLYKVNNHVVLMFSSSRYKIISKVNHHVVLKISTLNRNLVVAWLIPVVQTQSDHLHNFNHAIN
jgi:hypothetical protein